MKEWKYNKRLRERMKEWKYSKRLGMGEKREIQQTFAELTGKDEKIFGGYD